MGSWVPGKAPLEHLLLSSNPAVDTTQASVLSHPHSPVSWLMISLSFDALMKSFRLSWMTGPLLANYSIKCKCRGKRDWSYYSVFPPDIYHRLDFYYLQAWRHDWRSSNSLAEWFLSFVSSGDFLWDHCSSPVVCSHSQPRKRLDKLIDCFCMPKLESSLCKLSTLRSLMFADWLYAIRSTLGLTPERNLGLEQHKPRTLWINEWLYIVVDAVFHCVLIFGF